MSYRHLLRNGHPPDRQGRWLGRSPRRSAIERPTGRCRVRVKKIGQTEVNEIRSWGAHARIVVRERIASSPLTILLSALDQGPKGDSRPWVMVEHEVVEGKPMKVEKKKM